MNTINIFVVSVYFVTSITVLATLILKKMEIVRYFDTF